MKLIVGLGQTGFSFIEHFATSDVIVTDTRQDVTNIDDILKKYPNARYEHLTPALLARADQIYMSPGVDWRLPIFDGVHEKMVGDIALFASLSRAPIVAVTGSNGKTTVTTLLGRVFAEAGYRVLVGGNIGVPALALLQQPVPDVYVLELSSFQLHYAPTLATATAVVLNVTPDHLDRHADMQEYLDAKLSLYAHCKHPVVNLDAELPTPSGITYSVEKPADWCLKDNALCHHGVPCVSLSALALRAPHHYSNALAVLAMGHVMGLPIERMVATLKNFTGLPHRCEIVAEKNGVVWINDSKATNIGATITAMESIGKNHRLILIAGGLAKTSLAALSAPIACYATHVIALGTAAKEVVLAAGDVPVTRVASLREAIEKAHSLARAGDAVLLSPACASYDMFRNYEDRGDQFRQGVKEVVC